MCPNLLAGFHGPIKISDYDKSTKHLRFRGDYMCMGCSVAGVQILTIEREAFPRGVTEKEIEGGMKDAIQKNHKCRIRVKLPKA